MKRTLLFWSRSETALIVAGTALIAGTYGLVRMGYGLFLTDIRASVGLTSSQAGLIASGASVVYAGGALVGLVAERWPRLVVLGALVTASVGSAGTALASEVTWFAPAAIVSSAGAGLASPGLVGVVARGVSVARRDRAQAVVNSGTGPGLVAAGVLAWVLPDWRLGFAVGAVFTAAAGVAVLVLVRADGAGDGPAGLSAGARTADPGRPDRQPGRQPGARLGTRFGPRPEVSPRGPATLLALRQPAIGALLLGAASAAVWTYGRDHLRAEGLGAGTSTLAWMALGVGGTATVLTAGRQSRLPPARAWALTASAAAGGIVALAVGAGLAGVAVVACLVFGWAFVAATSALIAWAGDLVPERAAGGTAALFITLTLGQAVGSTALGITADHLGRPLAFLAATVVAALAAASGLTSRLAAPRARLG